MPAPYRGRFAPSPTGPLHFGSIIAALGSYLDARCRRGQWLVRIEDLDPPRELAGAAADILRTLERYGFEWDGNIDYQSHRLDTYRALVDALLNKQLAYPCVCSRSEIARTARQGAQGAIYPGTCRHRGTRERNRSRSIRLKTHATPIGFHDRVHGGLSQSLLDETGDFVIRRADGLFAYQLAVVVDDARQGITHVVRGADLLLSTPRQIHLQHLLDFTTPVYAHLPLVVDAEGKKLSKQTGSLPVTRDNSLMVLSAAYGFLGQEIPKHGFSSLDEFWDWALSHWRMDRVPGVPSLQPDLNPAK